MHCSKGASAGSVARIAAPALVAVALTFLGRAAAVAQDADDLRVFGFFQNAFQLYDSDDEESTTFHVQQLNVFLQRRLATRWSAFVNFEAVNSYSSSRRTGDFSLEEAWVRYDFHPHHNLKVGQLIPVFNHLNETKNRMPVLPYIIRPLVYEASFGEFLALEEYWPGRTNVQITGWVPWREAKLEYAAYVGNTPNVNADPSAGQTGVDTTMGVLVGGRLGVRAWDAKLGYSRTREGVEVESIDNTWVQLNREAVGEMGWSRLPRLTRRRYGWDVSVDRPRYYLHYESVDVDYSGLPKSPPFGEGAGPPAALEDLEPLLPSLDKSFHYVTVGVRPTDRYELYGTWCITEEDLLVDGIKVRINVFSAGGAYHLSDRLVLKAQLGYQEFDTQVDLPPRTRPFFPIEEERDEVYQFGGAVSVFF